MNSLFNFVDLVLLHGHIELFNAYLCLVLNNYLVYFGKKRGFWKNLYPEGGNSKSGFTFLWYHKYLVLLLLHGQNQLFMSNC